MIELVAMSLGLAELADTATKLKACIEKLTALTDDTPEEEMAPLVAEWEAAATALGNSMRQNAEFLGLQVIMPTMTAEQLNAVDEPDPDGHEHESDDLIERVVDAIDG